MMEPILLTLEPGGSTYPDNPHEGEECAACRKAIKEFFAAQKWTDIWYFLPEYFYFFFYRCLWFCIMADRAELSKGFISQLERDITSPSIATLVDVLQCLGTDLEEFFSNVTNSFSLIERQKSSNTISFP